MGKLKAFLLLLVALPVSATPWTGAYVWGGLITQHSGMQQFYDSVNASLNAGFTTIRFAITPGVVSTSPEQYPLTAYCSGNQNLACYAQVMFASSVWDNPNLARVVLTTQDWTCNNASITHRNGCLDAALLTSNATAIQSEYTALFNVLLTRFGARNIQFVISNWEGDNYIYCGAAYSFATDTTFASNCQTNQFSPSQTNVQRVQAFLQWVGYKDTAIAAFVAAQPSFNLIGAPELNNMFIFSTNAGGNCGGFCTSSTDTVYDQIVVAGKRSYCLYSSYDGTSAVQLSVAVATLVANACSNLIIGEAGQDYVQHTTASTLALWQQVINAQQVAGLAGIIPWNGVSPSDNSQNFGMFNFDGSIAGLNYLQSLRPAAQIAVPWR